MKFCWSIFAVVALLGAEALAVAFDKPLGYPLDRAVDAVKCDVGLGWRDAWVKEWRAGIDGLEVRDESVEVRPGLARHLVRWTWNGTNSLDEVVLRARIHLPGSARSYKPFLPGVLMYGNPSNAGRTDGRVPVYDGSPRSFAYFEEHRLPMPFALLDDGRSFTAVHTLPSTLKGAARDDLWWSLGVEAAEDGADIVLMSGPIGYNRRHSVAKATQGAAMEYDRAYIALSPGKVIEKTFWVETGSASDRFGFESALYTSLDLFRPWLGTERYPTVREIARKKRDFAMTRWIDEEGAKGFNMYDPRGEGRHIVLGWCGCAATCGWALPALGFDKADDSRAQQSLDFISTAFADHFLPEKGLFNVDYDVRKKRFYGGDAVSCGQGLYSVLKAISFAREHPGRLDASKWEIFARKAADVMADFVLSPEWQEPRSTGPGFEIAPLVLASRLFSEPRYLAAAERLADVFAKRYYGLDHVYWGGTLDASCEDKEGCYAAFQGYEALLRDALARGDKPAEKRWARLAEHAMNMMLTYTMVWDATYPPGRLADHAFRSSGWTVVSAQNQHLDAFGVLTVPEVTRMGRYLKDERLVKLADLMYRTCSQLTDSSGSLGEQIQQTNFAQRGDLTDITKLRGGYQERWTVFWLTAHFLNAAASL